VFEFIEAAVWRATEEVKMAVTGAYFCEVFARTKKLDPLSQTFSKMFRADQPARSLEERVEAARKFLGAKKKKAS
jgi:hypothetical protein